MRFPEWLVANFEFMMKFFFLLYSLSVYKFFTFKFSAFKFFTAIFILEILICTFNFDSKFEVRSSI